MSTPSPTRTEPVTTDGVLSVANAAVFLDCSTDHVRRLIADGKLGYLNIGRGGRAKIRIPRAALNRYLERNLVGGAA